ncbi:PilW family protein [Ramlibacter sp. XY19]|uniref:PilW family protein n=1 Tax=Ramlibacter paludis TaxID=2908000 RepID=UPI0023DB6E71|nr:PilW family protein [Ramlibacter paludis]MCG2595090.1 PilW family protein [Ramlibacter paludis]
MSKHHKLQGGFSLVEVLVASAVGLIVALAVTSAVVSSGRQFSILTGNVSAQSSAQISLSLIDQAARSAGAGFYGNGQTLCPTWNAYNGTTVISDGARFMPVRIVDGGGAGVSDRIVFTGGASSSKPLSGAPVMMDVSGASIQVSRGGDFANGEIGVIGAPGTGQPCTLFSITQAPTDTAACGGNATACKLLVRTPNAGLNPGPAVYTTRPTYGFDATGTTTGPAVVSRVGTAASGFRQDAFAVQCSALVRYNAFATPSLPACTSSPLAFGSGVEALATDIVLMHAQYGVSSTAASDVVTSWVEATGAWAGTPAAADIARIKAVRVVLVARSREADGGAVTAACTNGAAVANTGPCSFQDASAPVIDLSTVPVPSGRSWQNYRYRVHAAVLPLRAVIWSD